MLGESRRHDDGDRALGHFLLADDALDAAVVIDMGMAHHDARDGATPEVFGDELECGAGAFDAHERIEHDPAGIACHERDVGHVVAAHLVDAFDHFEEAVQVVELRVAPQARVGGSGRFGGRAVGSVEKRVGLLAPDHLAALVGQFERFGRCDEVSAGEIAFALVGKVEEGVHGLVGVGGHGRGILLRVVGRVGKRSGSLRAVGAGWGGAAAGGGSGCNERSGCEGSCDERAAVERVVPVHRQTPFMSILAYCRAVLKRNVLPNSVDPRERGWCARPTSGRSPGAPPIEREWRALPF